MLDLVKMDLYRMFKMKSLLVTTIIYTLYAYLFTWAELSFLDDIFSIAYGVILMLDSMLPLTFMSIFAVLFITFDTHSGFVKSYIGQIPSRNYRLASKLICCCVYLLIAFIYIVVCEVAVCIFIRGDVTFGDLGKMMECLLIAFLLHFAIICVILVVTTMFKTHIAPIIFSVCMALGIFQGVASLAYLLLRIVFEIDFDPTKYLLTSKIDEVCMSFMTSESYSVSKTVALAVIYIAVALPLSSVIFRKKDVA